MDISISKLSTSQLPLFGTKPAEWVKMLSGKSLKNMKVNSPLKEICPDKKITNHSARKTVVKKLQRYGVQRSDIITVTGHASEKGLDFYDEGDEQ